MRTDMLFPVRNARGEDDFGYRESLCSAECCPALDVQNGLETIVAGTTDAKRNGKRLSASSSAEFAAIFDARCASRARAL
jgi:hypothetical protein